MTSTPNMRSYLLTIFLNIWLYKRQRCFVELGQFYKEALVYLTVLKVKLRNNHPGSQMIKPNNTDNDKNKNKKNKRYIYLFFS